MIKHYAIVGIALSLNGCAIVSTSKFDAATGNVTEKSHTFVLAQKSALKGYKIFQHTGTAGGAAFGEMIGTAVKAAAK